MRITTGTPETRTEHTMPRAVMGLMASMGIPVLIAIIGIAVLGWGAISWLGAIIWGFVATVAFTLFGMVGAAMGITRMDLLDLLGSMMALPRTSTARAIGAVIHHVNGPLLAVAWAYGAALVGAVHPAIRRGQQDDPGPAATHFGRMTPAGSLLGHLVYGLVLGLTYHVWPLG